MTDPTATADLPSPAPDPAVSPVGHGTIPVGVPGHGTVPNAAPSPVAADAPSGYIIDQELGRGGMGVVYKAHEVRLNRPVALKMVLAGRYVAPAELVRFVAEGETLAALRHPNLVQVHHADRHNGLPYFVLEYVDGGTLADRVRDGPLKPEEAARLVEQVARGVAYCHAQGVLHRDLKPANVLLTPDGAPKVADFGLAKRLIGGDGPTASGAVLGTPSYMAPEQARGDGKEAGPAADVYALGATLYHLLTGRPPFQGPTPLDTVMQVMTDDPVPPRRLQPRVPRDLEMVTLKCLEKSPSRRYPTAEAVADDLARWQAGEPTTVRPPGPLARLWVWAQRIDRVRDAGVLTIYIAIILAMWNATGIVHYLLVPTAIPQPDQAVAHLAVLTIPMCVPTALVGYWCSRMRRPAFWIGMMAAPIYLAFSLACMVGPNWVISTVDIGDLHRANPGARGPVFGLMSVLAAVLTGAYMTGLIALYANRGRPLPPSTWLSK